MTQNDSGHASVAAGKAASRRSFLDVVLGLGVFGWLGSVLYPVLGYLKPLREAGPEGPVKLTPEQATKLEKDKFVIVKAGVVRLLVFQDANQEVRSLSAKCTHEGCTVQFDAAEQAIVCACHNGRFDLDGRNVSGPPPRPLEQYAVVKDDAGNVTVTLGKA